MVVLKRKKHKGSVIANHQKRNCYIINLDYRVDYRVRASTLMETLVATILVIVVFMLASMIMNNLFANTIKNDTHSINTYLNELYYQCKNEKLTLPYGDTFKTWEINIKGSKDQSEQRTIIIEAVNKQTQQHITKEVRER